MMRNFFSTTIGAQVTLQRGFDITKKQQVSGDIPVISSGGISSYHNEAKCIGPGVILGRKGNLGTVFYSESDYWPHDTSLWVRDFKSNIPRFVYYFFIHIADFLKRMDVGAANPSLNRNHVHSLPTNWACKEIQKEIVGILGALDNKIELNYRINQTLEQISQAIFKSWFIDFEPVKTKDHIRKLGGNSKQIERAAQAIVSGAVNLEDIFKRTNLEDIDGMIKSRLDEKSGLQTKEQQKELAETAKLFPDRFEASDLGEIPFGWKCSVLKRACSLIIDHRGKTPKKLGGDWSEKGYPAISAKNIKAGKIIQKDKIRFVDEELYKKWMKIELSLGDVVLTSEAPLGETFYLASNKKYVLSQRVYGLRADPETISGSFLYFWLKSHIAQFDLEARSTGSTVTGIRQSELQKVKILVPDNKVVSIFTKLADTILNKIQNNEDESITLSKKRDLLLPKLLSGEIHVTS